MKKFISKHKRVIIGILLILVPIVCVYLQPERDDSEAFKLSSFKG